MFITVAAQNLDYINFRQRREEQPRE